MKKYDLPKCQVSPKMHEERTGYHLKYGEMLAESVQNFYFKADLGTIIAPKPSGKHVPMAHQFEKDPFGAAYTIGKAGCSAITSYYILQRYDPEFEMDLLEWADEVTTQGYRYWCFSGHPKLLFWSKEVNVEEAKERFKGVVDLEECTTREELIQKLGEPVGKGGSMFLLDNVISHLSGNQPVKETRLSRVEDILFNLHEGYWVPIRVNNSIYTGDPTRQGGHYVTLFGVIGTNALVWDSSFGEVRIPFERLMKAAVANKGLIAAWDIIACA